jgi:hypothetical protein
MPTTSDVLDQHPQCFGEKTEIVTTPYWAWADIEDVLSAEWEIGGLAMPTDAIRALVAGE